MKLSDFCNEPIEKESVKKKDDTKDFDNDDATNVYNKYKNYNQSDLMEELINKTKEKKKNGTLNNEQLEDIKNKIAPFLNTEQSKNLENIFNMLK